MSDNLPERGWYDDPDGVAGRLRFWDGSQWTDEYASSGGSSEPDTALIQETAGTGPSYSNAAASESDTAVGSSTGSVPPPNYVFTEAGHHRQYHQSESGSLIEIPAKSPVDTIREAVFSNRAFDFKGRSRRAEYWQVSLFLMFLGAIIRHVLPSQESTTFIGLSLLISLVVLAIQLALLTRRLHDVGKSAWYILFMFVPVAGLVLAYWVLFADSQKLNQYGPSPKYRPVSGITHGRLGHE